MMPVKISVNDLTMSYGNCVIMKNLFFEIRQEEIFLIIGQSGCGKSTLLKYLLGLKSAPRRKILYDGKDINSVIATPTFYGKQVGVLYQGGALWSSMTLMENVALPLETHTNLSANDIQEIVSLKLSLVGLKGFENYYPSEISGGMNKRAALARAMALDPKFLFFDEPSAGLDPISARHLDNLILELNKSLGITMIVVTHDLDSIFAIGTTALYLDVQEKTATAIGSPEDLKNSKNSDVVSFLSRNSSN